MRSKKAGGIALKGVSSSQNAHSIASKGMEVAFEHLIDKA